jgi:DNA-binding ferritin-like protein (Dps family)
MEEAMKHGYREFIASLDQTLNFLEEELRDAKDISDVCTDEWCTTAENLFDDLHKEVYAISEPRWLKKEDSLKLRDLRSRVKNLYARFQSARTH